MRSHDKQRSVLDIVEDHTFGANVCFLCAKRLNARNRTEEDVIPKWLQRMFKLENQSITLLNGTTLKYRQLKIPCCNACNNRHLSQLENRVSRGLFKDSELEVTKHDLFCWLAKIMYGLIYRELHLPVERSQPHLGPITNKRGLDSFRNMLIMLQSVRVPMRFHCNGVGFPASVFAYKLSQPQTMAARFYLRDDLENKAIALRLGTRGILAVFDGGIQEFVVGDLCETHARRTLHPIQFEELAAKLFYKASLLNSHAKYVFIETGRHYDVIAMPEQGYSTRPLYKEWSMDEYAKYLAVFTQQPLSFINPTPGLVHSWLTDDREEPITIDIAEEPYRGVP